MKRDYFEGAEVAVTICSKDGTILDMNAKSRRTFLKPGDEEIIGKNVLDCHPEPARSMLADMLENPRTNVYTVEKEGVKKLIYQCPWYDGADYAGFMELSMVLPAEIPHRVRKPQAGLKKILLFPLAILLLLAGMAACRPQETAPAASVEVELRNPILPGFHPDPSVVAVDGDYYLINSSFHYFPGVPVYHSRDLQNWKQIGNVLDRPSQLPLEHSNASLGIYAPTIRYNDGTFYMITTNVGGGGNFMVTATDPAGPWSEPLWLEQQGIDPSLYFENGKCYMVSNPDATITLCEIDPVTGATLSPGKALWRGTGGRFPEGPHIYKRDGWYYLLISEGGTELAHKLTVARSRDIYGPYESNPGNPIFTHCSLAAQESNIQGTGHGDLFQAADGSWWIVFLAYRRYGGDYHHLGRETFLAPVTWEKGWPVINGGQPVAERMTVRMSAVPEDEMLPRAHEDFSVIGPEWMHIQHPVTDNYAVRDGVLDLTGNGDGFDWGGWHPTALLRRQEAATCHFGTRVSLQGDGEAGLVIYQTHNGHAEFFVRRGKGRPEAAVRIRLHSILYEPAVVPLPGPDARLDVEAHDEYYAFLLNGREIARMDARLLSTEMAGGFTGVTFGPYCRSGKASFLGVDY